MGLVRDKELNDVSPVFAPNDPPNDAPIYRAESCDGRDCPSRSAMERTNHSYGYGRQFGFEVAIASALERHVSHITRGIAEPQMVGIYAGRVIAGVADKSTLRNWPPMNLPREAMCSTPWRSVEKPIAFSIKTAGPSPASIRLLNVSPKSDIYWSFHGRDFTPMTG
jgi:hypothetical protein